MSAATSSVRDPLAGRSLADRRMRRLLRLDPDGPPASLMGAENVFGRSIAISATRCLLTYIVIPVLGPLVGLTGAIGPVLGVALSLLSMVALVAATRRFFAADHRWRWRYAAIAAAVFVLVVVQTAFDLRTLA